MARSFAQRSSCSNSKTMGPSRYRKSRTMAKWCAAHHACIYIIDALPIRLCVEACTVEAVAAATAKFAAGGFGSAHAGCNVNALLVNAAEGTRATRWQTDRSK